MTEIVHGRSVTWGERPRTYHALSAGEGPVRTLMLHANGFNGGTYAPLLEKLAPGGGWLAPDFRGHGGSFQPDRIRAWTDFVDDVQAWRATGRFERPVALGHSLGGMTALMAEAFHPGTFRAIALLDPIIFMPRFIPMMALMQMRAFQGMHPLAKGARARRMQFPSREAIVESYAKKKAFAAWDRPFLEHYIRWGTLETDDGVRLACTGETEAQIFSTWPLRFWFWVGRVACPVLIVRGGSSEAFLASTGRLLARKLAHAEYQEVEGASHFLPMEKPGAVVEAVRTWAQKNTLDI